MCSISGVYSKRGEDVSGVAFELLSGMRHRGPEAFGIKTPEGEKKSGSLKELQPLPKGETALGHSLLSITGHAVQPITSSGVSIAHNGQIYNFRDFNSWGEGSSDSEIIAGFFAKKLQKTPMPSATKQFMQKARGEYAIGLLHKKKLFAFRDPLGIRPLWFGENDSFIAFASEPHALIKVDLNFPRPLLPGHLLEVTEKGVEVKKIFSMDDFRKTVPKKHSQEALLREFEKTISLQTIGLEKAAVLFSGGVDSSLIAKAVSQRVPKTRLFVAGVEGSPDLLFAEKAAKQMGLGLEAIELSESDVQRLAIVSMKALSFFDEMQVGIAVPELACAERISGQGFKVVFSGQGSDEVFAGYSSYSKALKENGYSGVERETWFSLSRMWSRNFHRDDAVTARHSLELRVPLVSQNFLREAMAFPAKEKIVSESDSLRKHPLREIARQYGLPEEVIARPKKAMQYGSGVQKIVSRLLRA